jgi:GNAT superfamily N-acetyltransferase
VTADDLAEWQRPTGYVVSTDRARLDLDRVSGWLAQESYWAEGRPREVVERSIRHSLCFGLYDAEGAQLGFARVVTDCTTFAWLCDVFIDASARGRGLGSWLVGCALEHPDLAGVRRWMLATRDAHEVYARLGFRPLNGVERWMAIERPH